MSWMTLRRVLGCWYGRDDLPPLGTRRSGGVGVLFCLVHDCLVLQRLTFQLSPDSPERTQETSVRSSGVGRPS